MMRRDYLPHLMIAALCVVISACASQSVAGILVPQQVSFDASDLERALAQGPSNSSAGSSSVPSRRPSHEWPADENQRPTSPLELANSLPTSGGSSSTSTSPSGAVGSGVVVCVLNGTLALRDDSPLGKLAEDHGFSLPDPPGTELLRPPQPSA